MGEAAAGWLMLGVVLHLGNQVTRGRGWYAILHTASDCAPRRRDAIAAWIAGAGAGGLVSARGGDAVRVLLLRRRMPDTGCPLLAGTLVAEGVGELVVGALLLAVALAVGVGPQVGASSTMVAALVAAAISVGSLLALARRVPRLRRITDGVRRGCAPLRAPGAYARGVLPWQLASRAFRLASLGCFLAAFGVPVSPAAVLLVAFAQGGGRLVPFAPAAVGASVALLAASFGPVTGSAVSPERLAAFLVGTSTVLTVVGTALALAICLRGQASAKQGRSAGALLAAVAGRRAPARAATVPTP
ncbi:MAG TPA: lysylphosphatidylglycerol synthase domain-containing protein [Solirubrobacteraceae bacterium]|nr:lysylphosphatidylglycerol synthase domain-containing protein [Solirubrobacteraceae bacterium]